MSASLSHLPAPPGPGGAAGRFERRPWLTGLGLLLGAFVLLEAALRVADPTSLRFAQGMRRVHRYSRVSRVDLAPSRSARLRLDRSDGSPLLDFRLTTGADAFRVVEGAVPSPPAPRYVHAVGDSYTMGWGVDAAASYPAVLDGMLAPRLRVVNLGVDGFGTIGATAKSMALAERLPPAHAVYLFCPNDFADDLRAAAVARRPAALHLASEAVDTVRRSSYVAGIPFALRYRLRFQVPRAPLAAGPPLVDETGGEDLLLPVPALESIPVPDPRHPSLAALRAYGDFLAARGAGLTVLVLSTQPESLAAYRFCREQGIAAHLFEVPPGMRLADDGHFDASGNRAVARLVRRLVEDVGRDPVPEAGR